MEQSMSYQEFIDWHEYLNSEAPESTTKKPMAAAGIKAMFQSMG